MSTHCVVNHSVEYGKTAVVGGVTLRINTNHIERVGGGPEGAPSEAVPNVPRGADAGELPAVVPERAWGRRKQAASPP